MSRGRCEPIERLERTNRWITNAADQSPPGAETLRTNRTKLGLEVGRARIDGRPHVYTRLRSTYFHEADSALGFVDFNDPDKMSTPAGFMEAAGKVGFTFNWFYANEQDIAYFNSGNNPVRKGATDQDIPVRACGDDGDAECEFEWQGWDPDSTPTSPNMFVSDYTPRRTHPQAVNQPFLTSWNNKQARDYRAADDNFAYGSIHRSEPLDDRIGAGIAGAETMTRTELVDAMEDAGTVDLRGDKVLPYALQVLGEESDPVIAAALDPGPVRARARPRAVRRARAGGRRRRRHARPRRRAERERDARGLGVHRGLVRPRREGPPLDPGREPAGRLLAPVLRWGRPRRLRAAATRDAAAGDRRAGGDPLPGRGLCRGRHARLRGLAALLRRRRAHPGRRGDAAADPLDQPSHLPAGGGGRRALARGPDPRRPSRDRDGPPPRDRAARRRHDAVVRVAHPGRHVAHSPRPHPAVPGREPDQGDQAVLRGGGAAGGGLVRDEVALAEHDRFAVHPADRLHHVRVLAHDRGDGRRPREAPGESPLGGRDRVAVLVAPVHVHDRGVGAATAGPAGLAPGSPGAPP